MNPILVQVVALLAFTAVVLAVRVRTGHPPAWWHHREHHRVPPGSRGLPTLGRVAGPVIGMLLVAVAPWLAYLLIRPHTTSDAEALAIATALPLIWVLAHWVKLRRADVPGLIVVAVYGCAVGLSALFGDSPTPLKLRDAGVLGLVGLACIASVLAHRPLLLMAMRYLARQRAGTLPGHVARLDDPRLQRNFATATTLAGLIFLLATLTDVVLMATTSTATFLAVAGPVGGLTPLAATAAAVALLRLRSRV